VSQPADLDVDNKLGGQLPGGGVATYQIVRVRARCGYTSHDGNVPFGTNFGAGPQPETAATYDAVTGTGEQVALRHIDPYGNVMDLWKMLLVDWYWKLDGCPMPLTLAKIAAYQAAATPIRPWPANFAGKMPGEPTQAYPPFPPPPGQLPLSEVVTHEEHPVPEVCSSVPPVHDGRPPKLLGDVLGTFGPPPKPSEVNKVYADYARATMEQLPKGEHGPPNDLQLIMERLFQKGEHGSPNDLQLIMDRLEEFDKRLKKVGL
jgi:hypothetical protein